MKLKRTTRIHFPASSRDVTTLLIAPASCVGGSLLRRGRVRRDGAPRGHAGHASHGDACLEAAQDRRKTRRENELYDVAADPGMMRNRIAAPDLEATARALDDAIDDLWKEHSRAAFKSQIVRPA
jgi:hypothetical protein